MNNTRLIHHVGVGALEWLHAHRDGFRLELDADPEIGFLERFKPVGELALICKVLFREGVAGSRQAALARQLIDHAWRHTLDGGRMLVRGQHTEPLSPIPFEVYLPFKELGYSSPEAERAFRLNQRLDSHAALEMAPVRRLGLSAFQRRFGLPPRVPEADVVGATWLGRSPEPWTVEGHIAYDITHTVFHLTDWERTPTVCRPRSPTTSRTGSRRGWTTGSTCNAGTCSVNCSSSTPVCPAPRSTSGRGKASPPPNSPTARCPPCARCRRADPTRSSMSSTTRRWSPPSPPSSPRPAP